MYQLSFWLRPPLYESWFQKKTRDMLTSGTPLRNTVVMQWVISTLKEQSIYTQTDADQQMIEEQNEII